MTTELNIGVLVCCKVQIIGFGLPVILEGAICHFLDIPHNFTVNSYNGQASYDMNMNSI